MKLRVRLFLSIGSVLLLMSVLSYLLPRILVRHDFAKAGQEVKKVVHNETINTILARAEASLVHTISLNLLTVALFCLGLSLILLSLIAKKVTAPLVALAAATRQVEEGRQVTSIASTGGEEVETLVRGFNHMVEALEGKEKLRGILNKVVSKEIAEEIVQKKVELGGEEREVALLFSDVRQFTHLTENVPPRILINLVNTYLTQMCEIIDAHQGVVDKFVGDEIMALYGAPLAIDNKEVMAISTALKMRAALTHTNLQRQASNLPPITIGIGIHTGTVVAGNVGSENRLNYTVLGANVNIASRLCSAAQPMQILISEAVANAPSVRDHFTLHALPPLSVKGITHPLPVFEVQ